MRRRVGPLALVARRAPCSRMSVDDRLDAPIMIDDPAAKDDLDAIIARGRVRTIRESASTWVSVVVGIVIFVALFGGLVALVDAMGIGNRAIGWALCAGSLAASAAVASILRRWIKPPPLD